MSKFKRKEKFTTSC